MRGRGKDEGLQMNTIKIENGKISAIVSQVKSGRPRRSCVQSSSGLGLLPGLAWPNCHYCVGAGGLSFLSSESISTILWPLDEAIFRALWWSAHREILASQMAKAVECAFHRCTESGRARKARHSGALGIVTVALSRPRLAAQLLKFKSPSSIAMADSKKLQTTHRQPALCIRVHSQYL